MPMKSPVRVRVNVSSGPVLVALTGNGVRRVCPGVAERLLQGMEVAGLDQLPHAEAMEKIAALIARIDQAKANNPRLAALLANAH